jgi:SAM-dependent methyltransferase
VTVPRDPRLVARKAVGRIEATVRWERRLNDREERRFDRRLGVDTGGRLEPAALTVASGDPAEGTTYVGTQPRLARWWMSALPPDHGRFTFIDMGSGKGRVLLFAAEAGFARSMGVEFAEELHASAVENAAAAARHGLVIEPILGDATTFEFPDEPLVVHFNNPFTEKVMAPVLDNLSSSYARTPRPIVVVYQRMRKELPGHDLRNFELLDAVPFLRGHELPPPRGFVDRRVVRPFVVRIYQSPEAAQA